MFHLEAHAGLLMKGIFDPYVLWSFDKNWFLNLAGAYAEFEHFEIWDFLKSEN